MVNRTTASRLFSVAMLGVRDFDKRLLSGIFELSMSRNRSYHETELDLNKPPDIIMLGAEDELALGKFKALFLDSQGRPTIPTIQLSKNAPKTSHFYHLSIPCRAPHVLSVLDEITAKELNFLPELTIGNDNQDHTLSDKVFRQLGSGNLTDQAREKALVVDDSPVVRKQIELQLNLLNIAADTAKDGQSALDMVNRGEYMMIFLDVVMPGIDGYKVCKVIKKSPETRSTPVIMLTGKSSPFDRVKGKLAGCDSYLTKPVEREAFEKTVKPYLLQATETGRQSG